MARPTSRSRGPISEAMIKLRQALGDNQQQFANRTKTAVTTIARYETIRPPKGRILAQLARIAETAGRHDIAKIFDEALQSELGTMEARLTATEQVLSSAMIDVYRAAPNQLITAIEELIKRIKNDPVRLNQLESLLVLLRKDSGPVNQRAKARIAEIAARDGITTGPATLKLMQEDPRLFMEWEREGSDAGRGTMFEKSMALSPSLKRKRGSRK